MTGNKTAKKQLASGIVTVAVLAVCLCITTLALVYSMVSVEGNLFQTGRIEINLNDGKPVITEDEFLFEPGATVEKQFFIENTGTWGAYYKIYMENLEGGLADVLEVTLRDGETVLYSGTAAAFTKENTVAAQGSLAIGERRELTISFHFPEDAGNSAQDLYLSFDLRADAVQTKNNPTGLFE